MLPRAVIPRLKLDVGWSDLAVAAFACLAAGERGVWAGRAERAWSDGGDVFACLSIRTGWDLLLGSLALPKGSEVLLSAITIGHMAEIIEAHGLVPVPVDLDPETLEPLAGELERLVTPRTRILLVAHLFGARADIAPLSQFAERHNLMFVEDCAQAFTGTRECIDKRAAVSMISFGPIKTATALGGAILVVRRPELLAQMRRAEAKLPIMETREFRGRVLKFGFLKLISIRWIFGLLCWMVALRGGDLDKVLGASGRAFPPSELLKHIRHRAPAPMMRLLARRLRHYDGRVVRERAKVGRALAKALHGSRAVRVPGLRAGEHTFWVFPVSAKEPEKLGRQLRAKGFDCTVGASAMKVIEAPARWKGSAECPGARRVLEGILYLPVQPGLTRREVRRLAEGVS